MLLVVATFSFISLIIPSGESHWFFFWPLFHVSWCWFHLFLYIDRETGYFPGHWFFFSALHRSQLSFALSFSPFDSVTWSVLVTELFVIIQYLCQVLITHITSFQHFHNWVSLIPLSGFFGVLRFFLLIWVTPDSREEHRNSFHFFWRRDLFK